MSKFNGIELLELVDWYAVTNMGTGKDDPHSVILRSNNRNGTGTSTKGLNKAIELAFKDLMRSSTTRRQQ